MHSVNRCAAKTYGIADLTSRCAVPLPDKFPFRPSKSDRSNFGKANERVSEPLKGDSGALSDRVTASRGNRKVVEKSPPLKHNCFTGTLQQIIPIPVIYNSGKDGRHLGNSYQRVRRTAGLLWYACYVADSLVSGPRVPRTMTTSHVTAVRIGFATFYY